MSVRSALCAERRDIVSGSDAAHIRGMTAPAKPSASKPRHSAAKAGSLYRGVRLQPTNGRSRFTLDRIKQAVEAAVVKHADALAGKTKA